MLEQRQIFCAWRLGGCGRLTEAPDALIGRQPAPSGSRAPIRHRPDNKQPERAASALALAAMTPPESNQRCVGL
jgi:hypothetical protein